MSGNSRVLRGLMELAVAARPSRGCAVVRSWLSVADIKLCEFFSHLLLTLE